MKLKHLYIEDLERLPKYVQKRVLKEAPHGKISGVMPPPLEFLSMGLVDLGFEDLGMGRRMNDAYHRAFVSEGVIIPHSGGLKLRNIRPLYSQIERVDERLRSQVEQAHGRELVLPDWWIKAVLVMGDKDEAVWIGDMVREDRKSGFDLSQLVRYEWPGGIGVPGLFFGMPE